MTPIEEKWSDRCKCLERQLAEALARERQLRGALTAWQAIAPWHAEPCDCASCKCAKAAFYALSTPAPRVFTAEEVRPLVEAIKPFAKCGPIRMGSIKPSDLFLWKRSDSRYINAPGISAEDVDKAAIALAHARKFGMEGVE